MTVTATVSESLAGDRLDRVVAFLCDVSRSTASRLVGSGAVHVDGVRADRAAHRLRVGELVEIDDESISPAPLPAADSQVRFDVVHEDGDVLVVEKPAGLVVHPGAGHPDGTLVNGLLARYPEIAVVGESGRPGIVHRLDRDTTGLMLVARTQEAYDGLVAELSQREVTRVYRAVVWGAPEPAEGIIDAPIGRSAQDPTRMAVVAEGRPAVTEFRTLRSSPLVALLECRLQTGRTHQIRVHCRAVGHPVVGDRRYGGSRPGLSAARPMLHAAALGFRHPRSGDVLEFTSADPADLAALIVEAGLDQPGQA